MAEAPFIFPDLESDVSLRETLAAGEPGGGQHDWHTR
jgi:hypothetical protein